MLVVSQTVLAQYLTFITSFWLYPTALALVKWTPFSDRQRLSYDDCLEVRGEIIRTVLCCIVC